MPAPQLIITIMPDRTLHVSLCDADGTPRPLPPIAARISNRRLRTFVDNMQALARERLGAVEDLARRQRVVVGGDDQPGPPTW